MFATLPMPRRFQPESLRHLLAAIDELLDQLAAGADHHAAAIAKVPTAVQPSARNLACYLAARQRDLRPLQEELRRLSLSSLGRMESDVVGTVHGVRMALQALLGELPPGADGPPALDGDRRLLEHTEALLGPPPADRGTRIMVTLPSAAAHDPGLAEALVRSGMDLARVNLAHDDEAAWTAMARHVRQAAKSQGRPCRILVDLPGPKLRTGHLTPGPQVLRIRPRRDVFGRCEQPATVTFVDPAVVATMGIASGSDGTPRVPLDAALARHARAGDELLLTDARGKRRRFTVLAAGANDCIATTDRTCYLQSGGVVALHRGITLLTTAAIGELPPVPAELELQVDDLLVLTRDQGPGQPARTGADGQQVPAHIPCTLPQVFCDVRPDQRILFDDGKIAGLVVGNDGDRLRIRITSVPPGGGRLRAEKGINLPDSELHTTALTDDDLDKLDWVARHADLVGMSFVQRPADVLRLHDELARRGRADLGLMLKVETALGFQRLPELLFAGLRNPPLGVMVARGDLAVEVGHGRLAEVQEEILWLCEAAHVPVVWATQVLDAMARTGLPSRAEVTDAAMGVRAECVMLNKGPHIAATVAFLGGVLHRMQEHTTKKRSLLRRLRVAGSPAGAERAGGATALP